MILEAFNYIIKMLLPNYAKKLWKSIIDSYVKQFVKFSLKASSDIKEICQHLDKDQALIKDIFSSNVTNKDIDECLGLLNNLIIALSGSGQ